MVRSQRTADATVSAPWTIVGQGLAGTCLAWEFWQRGVEFSLVDRETGGSSRVAAGLVNPVTGKNFEPSPRIGEFLPEALERHKDDLHGVEDALAGGLDDCLEVQLSLADPAAAAGEGPRGLAVHLIPDSREQPQVPDWFGYRLI